MQSFQLHFTEIDNVLKPLGMRATVSVPNFDPKWSEKILGRIRGVLEHVDFNPATLRNATAVVLIDEPERVVACCVLFFLPLPDNAMKIIWEGVIPSHREMQKTLYLAVEKSSRMVVNRDLCIALNLLDDDEFGVWVPVSKARKSRDHRRFLERLGYINLRWESKAEFMFEKLLPVAHPSEAAFTNVDGTSGRLANEELAFPSRRLTNEELAYDRLALGLRSAQAQHEWRGLRPEP